MRPTLDTGAHSTQHTSHSTQHTGAHSTQHTAHSIQERTAHSNSTQQEHIGEHSTWHLHSTQRTACSAAAFKRESVSDSGAHWTLHSCNGACNTPCPQVSSTSGQHTFLGRSPRQNRCCWTPHPPSPSPPPWIGGAPGVGPCPGTPGQQPAAAAALLPAQNSCSSSRSSSRRSHSRSSSRCTSSTSSTSTCSSP
jgi:hypothetical protein